MLFFLISKHEIYYNDNFLETSKIIKEIILYASKINENLNLFSKYLFSLKEIIEVINIFYLNKINNKENIENLIKIINEGSNFLDKIFQNRKMKNKKNNDNENNDDNKNDENENNIENNLNNLTTYVDNLIKFIVEQIGNDKNTAKIMNMIFENEFSKIPFMKVSLYLLKKIISKNEYIYESPNLINLILKEDIKISPNEFKKNIKALKKKDNELINILNNNENPF